MFGGENSVFEERWPWFDENALVKDEIEIAIQINGKIKERVMVDSSFNEDQIKENVLALETIQSEIGDKTIVKVIVIKGRLVNIVVKG